MKKLQNIGAFTLIIVGIVLIFIGIYPLFSMSQQMNESVSEWEQLKEQAVVVQPEDEVEEEPSPLLDNSLIGLMTIAEFEKQLPIRVGITNAILDKGIGLDVEGSYIGEAGNTVLYGHREGIFWDLKDVEIGDTITVETLDGMLTYKITEIEIVSPSDPYIYRDEDDSVITLVTCYPFIYMGPITDRYIVKATLQE